MDGSFSSKSNIKVGQKGNREFRTISGVEVQLVFTNNYSDCKKEVLKSKEKGLQAIFLGAFHTLRENDKKVPDNEVLNWISQNSPVPLFCFWNIAVGKGKAIGGYLIDGVEHGKAAGEVALKILEKKLSPKAIRP